MVTQTTEDDADSTAASEGEDENEMYLRYLDTDTTEIINNLKSQVQQVELKATSWESASHEKEIQYEELVVQIESEKKYHQQLVAESAVSELLNDLLSSALQARTVKDIEARVTELELQLQEKEAEVLWVRAEAEDREEKLRRSQKEKETNNPSRSAFLQCGLMIPDPATSVEPGLQQKVEELQKILVEKEDHFSRELEVLRRKNTSLREQTESQSGLGENVKSLEAELETVTTKYNQLLQDFQQKDIDVGVLNVSLSLEKEEIEESQREKDQLKQENCELMGKIEATEARLAAKLALSSKQRELEVATLRSELERTKDKLKQSQEANIKVHEDLFIEHKEILEGVRSMSEKKRKRFLEETIKEAKRLRESEEPNLLDDTLEGSFGDPKENIGLQLNDVVGDEELASGSETEFDGGKLIDKEEASKPQVILASWDL